MSAAGDDRGTDKAGIVTTLLAIGRRPLRENLVGLASTVRTLVPRRRGFDPIHKPRCRWVIFWRRPTGKLLVKPRLVGTGLYLQNDCPGRVKNSTLFALKLMQWS